MVLAALGTIRAETEGFVPITERPSRFNTSDGQPAFNVYEGKKTLGNTQAGDGARFCGRGFVQLTGRHNYARYSEEIGVDLLAEPELANAPEIAAAILALFLLACAKPMRAALAAGNYQRARRLVNGGSHGLEQFRDVFMRASRTAPAALGVARHAGRATRGASASAKPASTRRPLTARKDPIDLRDRPYLPPPISLLPEFPSAQDVATKLPRYSKARLILDQGQEGACTGFGLACVVNHLRWRRLGYPARMDSVSPRMLYSLARRYDEYAGEDYDGSSCRGALKGWFRHGVCLEEDWPYNEHAAPRSYGYAQRATENTLGVYYRVDLTSVTDLQSAIQQVGAVYVSAYTHDGWDRVPNRKTSPKSHSHLPVVPFDGRPSKDGGHAFALVGFNANGFVVQNSWGRGFGAGGFAVLSYADWFANGMDAWVCALGVPKVVGGVVGRTSGRRGGAAGLDRSRWWDEAKAYEHSIVSGNDGRVQRYLTEDESSRALMHQVAVMPDRWFRANAPKSKKRLVIYAHGGLNAEEDALARARALGPFFTGNDCYPLFWVWKSGLLESIGDMYADRSRNQPALVGGIGGWLAEQTDAFVEKTLGRGFARPVWSEMKENAELACNERRSGDLLSAALAKVADTWGDDFELHLVGHSAGSILLGHLLTPLEARGLTSRIASIELYAPACTVHFANRHYASRSDLMKRLHLAVLSDANERDDNVVGVYRKSLLYLVSNALEADPRTPILGLAKVGDTQFNEWDGSSATTIALKAWRDAALASKLSARTREVSHEKIVLGVESTPAGVPKAVTAKPSHGGFDNDTEMVTATLERITGAGLKLKVEDLRGF
ncbi:MAG: C1 family peptidase [Vicinamibacterales bacterium]